MTWFPLCNYTHYSLLKGFSKPKELAKKCAENNFRACGIADYKTISGSVAFYKACVANDVKPIIGCSFDKFTLFAKNKDGWFDLIKIVSLLDADGNYNSSDMSDICNKGNLLVLAESAADSPVKSGWYNKTKCFQDMHYVEKEDANLHRILLCSEMKTTLPKMRKLYQKGEEFDNKKFFDFSHYFVPDKIEATEVMLEDPEGLQELEKIYNECENYNILSNPKLPKFKTPNGESEEQYLTKLARKGWKKKLPHIEKDSPYWNEYGDRFRKEFDIIKEAKLSGYFLIVQDIIQYAKDQGWMVGPGRGSAAGCLISYLIGITEVDPIEFDLLFERFYNPGRNTKDNISLPDIDIDIPGKKRDQIIENIKDKYGHENVSQMVTFGRLQGRSAIKEILRVNEACGFSVMNEITKYIPDEAAISDQLSQMDEEDRSIIRWALQNNSEGLYDYCHVNDKGYLEGDYAEYFEQAIKIEGTLKTQGKHAAGVVISAEPLGQVCPMVNSKSSKEKIAGLEMTDLEALGHVKFDVLAINLLDKLMYIEELIKEKNE
jgi:DNA polymerase-3 subunit alpha